MTRTYTTSIYNDTCAATNADVNANYRRALRDDAVWLGFEDEEGVVDASYHDPHLQYAPIAPAGAGPVTTTNTAQHRYAFFVSSPGIRRTND